MISESRKPCLGHKYIICVQYDMEAVINRPVLDPCFVFSGKTNGVWKLKTINNGSQRRVVTINTNTALP